MKIIILQDVLKSLGDLSINCIIDVLVTQVVHISSLVSLLTRCCLFHGLVLIGPNHLVTRGVIRLSLNLFLLVDEGVKPLKRINKLSGES